MNMSIKTFPDLLTGSVYNYKSQNILNKHCSKYICLANLFLRNELILCFILTDVQTDIFVAKFVLSICFS